MKMITLIHIKKVIEKKKKTEIIMLLIICALIKTTSVEILKILITIMVMVKVIT